jgi:microcystin-dependent protein
MSDPYLGQILAVAFNFAPVNWALCDGSLLSIAEYSALYTLIGTTYGGDGQSTFGLPDIRGRVPIAVGQGQSQGQSLSSYYLGQVGGSEQVTLTPQTMPQHSHPLFANNAAGTSAMPLSSLVLATEGGGGASQIPVYNSNPPADLQSLAPSSILPAGQSLPHENRQPFLAVNYIIALAGVFPSQN